jgi:acyl-CoA synthetase (AMP-forming)/AMP-acid ligase II
MDSTAYLRRPAAFAAAGVLRGLTSSEALARTVASSADRPAVISADGAWSWSEIAQRTRALAAALRLAGLGEGDVVGVHLPNSWQFLVAHLAVADIGAVMLPLHLPYRERELETYLGFAEARAAFVVRGAGETKLNAIRERLPALEVAIVADVAARDEAFAVTGSATARAFASGALDPDLPFCLLPTSGTESLEPKLCMHAHDGLLSNALAVAESAGVSSADRLIVGGGYTHLFGLLGVHVALVRGAALLALPAYSPEAFLELARRAGATLAWAPPAQLSDLAAARERGGAPQLALREVRTAGAPVGTELGERVRALLCSNLVVHWGMSEIGAGITTAGTAPEPKLIGRPLAGAEARVVDAQGRDAAPGEVGELWYRRGDMFRGYYRDPAITDGAMSADGWLRTGDLASHDGSGRFWYEGREKDLINRGGFKISTYEIEVHLGALEAIRQAAVVCVPDDRLGEKACLCVSLRAGTTLTLADVRAHLDERGLAKYKWPEHLIVLDELPATPTGKIWKKTLRELAGDRVREGVTL